MAAMFTENLGIKVEISNEDWAVYYDNILAGNYEVGAMGWGADYLHPMTFLPLLVSGDPNNHTGYSNPEYDALVAQAQQEIDPVTAMDIMRRAEALTTPDYPLLYVFHRSNSMLMHDNVQGYYFDYSGGIWLRTAFVSE